MEIDEYMNKYFRRFAHGIEYSNKTRNVFISI